MVRGDHHTAGTEIPAGARSLERQRVSTLAGARSHTVMQSLQEWIGCRGEGGVCTVCYLTCMFDVCSLSEKVGIEITAGIKLHCREKSSHDGNKTRQQWSQSQCKNGLVVEDKARCIRCVTLLVCLTCVSCPKRQGLKSPRESSSTVGRKACTTGTKLARREQNSPAVIPIPMQEWIGCRG